MPIEREEPEFVSVRDERLPTNTSASSLQRRETNYELMAEIDGTMESRGNTELCRTVSTPRTHRDVASRDSCEYDIVVDIPLPGTGTFQVGANSLTSQLPHVRLTAPTQNEYQAVAVGVNDSGYSAGPPTLEI